MYHASLSNVEINQVIAVNDVQQFRLSPQGMGWNIW